MEEKIKSLDVEGVKKLKKKYGFYAIIFGLVLFLLFCSGLILFVYVYVHENPAEGYYVPGVDIIISLPGNQSRDNIQKEFHVLKHELGHRFWYTYMTDEDRAAWEELFESESLYVSKYAETSAVEDFAESFAYSYGCYYDSFVVDLYSKNKSVFMKEVTDLRYYRSIGEIK